MSIIFNPVSHFQQLSTEFELRQRMKCSWLSHSLSSSLALSLLLSLDLERLAIFASCYCYCFALTETTTCTLCSLFPAQFTVSKH